MTTFKEKRPYAYKVANIAAQIERQPMTTTEAQVSTLSMIAYAILDHSDAVRELTAALDRKDESA